MISECFRFVPLWRLEKKTPAFAGRIFPCVADLWYLFSNR